MKAYPVFSLPDVVAVSDEGIRADSKVRKEKKKGTSTERGWSVGNSVLRTPRFSLCKPSFRLLNVYVLQKCKIKEAIRNGISPSIHS